MANSSSDSSLRVLLVVPAYNEEDSILGVVDSITARGYDFVVVNDGSTDSTAELCLKHGIPLLNLADNLGIGGAVQTGYIYAQEMNYDIAIQFDADGQHDADSVPALVAAIAEGADFVIGSRFLNDAEENFQTTHLRRLGIKWLSAVIKLMTGQRIYDVTSGFRAAGKRAIELFSQNYPQDYPEPEAIAIAAKRNLVIKEIPVQMHERQGGVSSINALSSVYYMIKVTLAILIQGMSRPGKAENR